MAQLSMREIVNQLRKSGHTVRFRERTDGGIIITEIDGKKYPRAGTGNKEARRLTGAENSKARQRQTETATIKRERQRKIQGPKQHATKAHQRRQRKINRKRRRNDRTGDSGFLSESNIVYWEKNYSPEQVERMLDEAERYAEGLAYTKNVQHLIQAIENFRSMQESEGTRKELREIIDYIKSMAGLIKDSMIEPLHKLFYDRGQIKPSAARLIKKEIKFIIGGAMMTN